MVPKGDFFPPRVNKIILRYRIFILTVNTLKTDILCSFYCTVNLYIMVRTQPAEFYGEKRHRQTVAASADTKAFGCFATADSGCKCVSGCVHTKSDDKSAAFISHRFQLYIMSNVSGNDFHQRLVVVQTHQIQRRTFVHH